MTSLKSIHRERQSRHLYEASNIHPFLPTKTPPLGLHHPDAQPPLPHPSHSPPTLCQSQEDAEPKRTMRLRINSFRSCPDERLRQRRRPPRPTRTALKQKRALIDMHQKHCKMCVDAKSVCKGKQELLLPFRACDSFSRGLTQHEQGRKKRLGSSLSKLSTTASRRRRRRLAERLSQRRREPPRRLLQLRL